MSSGDESSTSQTIPRPASRRGRPKKRPRPPSRKKQSQPMVTIESVDISAMDISMDSTPLIASSPYAEASAEDNDSTPVSTPVKRKPGRPRREQIKRRKKENGRIDRKGNMEEGMDEDEEVERKNSEEGFKENIVLGEKRFGVEKGRGREKEKNREKGKIEKDKDGNRDNNATVDSNKRAELTDKSADKTTEGSVATKDTEDEKGEQKITRDGLLLG
ncbi:3860_t:CDS:2, partial [Paraglomus occultum]